MPIPIPGIVTINAEIVVIYQLEKVVENKAYFNITVNISMTPDNSSYTLNASGSGEGKLIHDLQKNISLESDMDMTMSFEITKDKFHVNSNFSSKGYSKITY